MQRSLPALRTGGVPFRKAFWEWPDPMVSAGEPVEDSFVVFVVMLIEKITAFSEFVEKAWDSEL